MVDPVISLGVGLWRAHRLFGAASTIRRQGPEPTRNLHIDFGHLGRRDAMEP